MNERWIANASPLILLGKVGLLDLLTGLCPDLLVPDGVSQELCLRPSSDPARIWVEGEGAARLAAVESVDPVVAAWDLGLGESHVLTLCRTMPGTIAILDDRAARTCAAALGIRVRGTLAVLVLAKLEGLLPELEPILEELAAKGMHLDPELVTRALRLACE